MNMNMEISNSDIQRVIRQYGEITERQIKALKKAMLENGFNLLEKSLRVTPKDTGALRESGKVVVGRDVYATGNGNGRISIVSTVIRDSSLRHRHKIEVFVGYETEYAVKVHEWIPEPNWTTPGTGPKYLEGTLNQQLREYNRNLHNKLLRAMAG